MDAAGEKAATLLPCSGFECPPEHWPGCTAHHRPAVAAALRERDEKIAEMNQHFENLCELESDALRQCHKRIAALETELQVARSGARKIEAENAELRRKLDSWITRTGKT